MPAKMTEPVTQASGSPLTRRATSARELGVPAGSVHELVRLFVGATQPASASRAAAPDEARSNFPGSRQFMLTY